MHVLEFAGEDDALAAAEARTTAASVEPFVPGLALARGLDPEGVGRLALTRRASELVGRTDADLTSARALLEAASIDRSGTVAVRARDVRDTAGVDTQATERELGQVLVDRGFTVDLEAPDHELRALFADDACAIGWLAAESVRDYGERQPTDKPFFQPGSMDPLLARAVANLAGARPGVTLLDPMCGTGGLLVEAGLAGADVVAADAQDKMAHGARENLAHYLEPGAWTVIRGDATHLPLRDEAVDGVVFDAPYGRQSKIAHRDLDDLVAGALAEARRVAPRAVVVGDRDWSETAVEAGWSVEATFERRVHRSLDRYVLVLVDPKRGVSPDT